MKTNSKAILMTAVLSALILTVLMSANSYAACTAITSLPRTLSQAGTYCLTGNLTTAATITAITISGDDITLDFAGFELQNTNPWNGYGVSLTNGTHKNITVRNGRITGFDRSVHFGEGGTTPDAYISNFVIDGINADAQIKVVGDNGIIRNCTANGSNSSATNAISVRGSNMTITNNDVFSANGSGIVVFNLGVPNGANNIVENNRIKNAQTGIEIGTDNSLAVNNRVINSGTGLDMSQASTGKYRDNLITNCTTSYTINPGVADAGNNN